MAQAEPRRIDFPEAFYELTLPSRYKVFYGGRGGGRSWSFARVLLLKSLEKQMRILCAREFQQSIEDSVYRLLSDQIQMLGLQGQFRVMKSGLEAVNGSSFSFIGIRHNVTKVKSFEGVDICWVEEAEKVSQDSWDVLIPTIRKTGSEIWVSFNPHMEDDPTYKRFVLNPPPDSIVEKTSWRDNPWLPDELRNEKDYLWSVDAERAAHVWDGECLQHTDAQVLKGKYRVDTFSPVQDGPGAWDGPYYGADWGFAQDPTALVRFWLCSGSEPGLQRLMVEHEAYGYGTEMDDTPKLFDQVPGSRERLIEADNARPETISHMQKRGFRIAGAPKWSGSVEDGINWLRSMEEIVIHSRCENAATEARMWAYKIDPQNEKVLPKLKPGFDHGWDAIRYGASAMIQNRGSAARGLIVHKDWWRQWPAQQPPRCNNVLQFFSTAMGDRDSGEYSARTTWGIFRRAERWDGEKYIPSEDPADLQWHCILLERWLSDDGFPSLREAAVSGVKKFEPDWVFVEQRASGKMLLQELRRAKVPARAVKPSMDYTEDMHYAAILPEQGRVWHMERGWADDVIVSTTAFPQTDHANLAHSCSMAWAWLRNRNEIAFSDEDDDAAVDIFTPAAPVYG